MQTPRPPRCKVLWHYKVTLLPPLLLTEVFVRGNISQKYKLFNSQEIFFFILLDIILQ